MSEPTRIESESELARALFAPARVALIGASSDRNKNTGRPQRFLAQHGFKGEVFPVNPARDTVQGVTAYPCVSAISSSIDHALVMVPRERVAPAIEDCAKAGVKVVTVYSDGFADLGTSQGIEAQQALLALAQKLGVRLIGPNSMGVFNIHHGLTLSVNAILEMPHIAPGSLSVISQSGSILGSLLSRGAARGIGFAKMVSVGNEADVSVGELLDLLVDDEVTECVLLFLESLRGAQALARAARRAYEAGKAVVAYKLGRSELGRRLASTHSGAMTGEASIADVFFRTHGIARVMNFETLLEVPPLLRAGAKVRKRQVSVMTTTGGGAATVVDRLGEQRIATVPAPAAVSDTLADIGIDVAGKAITDLTMAGAKRDVFERTLRGLLDEPSAQAVVVVVGSSGQFHPQLTVEPIVAACGEHRALAVYIVPDAPQSLALLRDAGIAAFRTPEGCADAVRALLEWAPPVAVENAIRDVSDCVHQALKAGVAHGFDELRAAAVFAALGIAVAPSAAIGATEAQPQLSYPVALKMRSAKLSHKTDVNGVVLGLSNPDELANAIDAMRERVQQQGLTDVIDGFLVQSMQRGVAEAVIGFSRDGEVGPIVSVGMGGQLTEIYRDMAIRLAPVTLAQAREMIAEVKGLVVIQGFRNLPRGDVDALAHAIVAMSQLALVASPVVMEAEINPLIVRAQGDGVVAVDAVLNVAPVTP